MSENRPRNESGKFTEKVTEQDILKIFDGADEPVLTASEIAVELPVTRDAVIRRLETMRERGLLGKKKTGARSVAWWAEYAPQLSDEARRRVEAADPENAVSLDELEARFADS